MEKFYIIKNCGVWMMDEMLALADISKFNVVFLRKQDIFFADRINTLREKGIGVIYSIRWENVSFKKIAFCIRFIVHHFICLFNLHSLVYGLKSLVFFLKTDLRSFNVKDVKLHAQFATQAAIFALMIKEFYKSENIKYSFTCHAYDIYVRNRWLRVLADKADAVFTISNYNVNYILKNYSIKDASRIKYSPLGVFRPDMIKRNSETGVLHIGFMCFFVEMKGINYLLPAMKVLNDMKFSFILHMAGDGPLKSYIISFIEKNGLKDRVILHGLLKNQEKVLFFQNIDVFILPSISNGMETDGLPVVLMEAASYGIPIISTKVSGIPEICMDGYNGFLIHEKSVAEIVDSIIKFSNDSNARIRYSGNSLKISENYDIVKNSGKKLQMMHWD